MTETEQRIAIAKWLGWEWKPMSGPLYAPWWNRETKERASTETLPNYTSDLNAIHEVEARLDGNQRLVFGSRLYEVTGSWNPETARVESWKETHATAAQRAEALLRTIGLWTDTKEEP